MLTVTRRTTETNKPVIATYEGLDHEQKTQLERWRTLMQLRPSIKGLQLAHSKITIKFLVETLRMYPNLFRSTGRAPFIHPLLAGTRRCDHSNAIFKTCFSKREDNLHHHVYSLINCRPQSGNLDGLLTAIQALLLALMSLLFSGPTFPDAKARHLLQTLATWTQSLYDRLPQMLPLTLTPWQAWVFAESVRRTILMSHFLIVAYSSATTGTFLLNTFYVSLPFDGRTGLWDNVLDPGDETYEKTDIISYKEYTEEYKAGTKRLPADSTSFETLLTVACTGYETVRDRGDILPIEPQAACDRQIEQLSNAQLMHESSLWNVYLT